MALAQRATHPSAQPQEPDEKYQEPRPSSHYGFLLLTIRLCKSPPERGLSGRMSDRKKHAPKPPTTLPVPRRTSSSSHSRSRPKWPRHAPPYGGRTAPKLPLSSCVFLILVGFASAANPHAPSTTRRRAGSSYATFNLPVTEEQGSRRRETAYPQHIAAATRSLPQHRAGPTCQSSCRSCRGQPIGPPCW